MPSEAFTIKDDFPPVSYDEWRAVVEADLQGAPFEKKLVTHTYEGVDLQPIYTRADRPETPDPLGFPGLAPFVRGSRPLGAVTTGWDLRQEHAHPDVVETNKAVVADLEGGVTSILLRLDAAARAGLDPDSPGAEELAGHDGVAAYSVVDLDAALKDVRLELAGAALDAGAAFLPAAAAMAALWRKRIPLDHALGALGADPLGVLARDGRLPYSIEDGLAMLAQLAKWTHASTPHVPAVAVDTSVYHTAGATAVQDIAFGLATGLAYLRAMVDAGMDVAAAARQILFRVSVGTHSFLAISKLRAGREVWARVVDECAGYASEAAAQRLHVRTSDRVLTQRDPYVNLLRNTTGVFAAGVGGAEIITSVPLDHAVGLPSEFSRRIARNTALVLQEEAHLHRVIDPAGGSWLLDTITEQLADGAWKIFQEIEKRGGMAQAIQSGWVEEQIDTAYAPRAKDIARRKEGITGVSEFPNVEEAPLNTPAPDAGAVREAATRRVGEARGDVPTLASGDDRFASAVDAAEAGATIGQLAGALGFGVHGTECKKIEPRSFAEPFEELRDASDAYLAKTGRRPKVLLANMGPIAHHTARAFFSKNFFEAGGFEVETNNGFPDANAAAAALKESGASIAVICSSDKLYPDVVPQLAPRLKQAGARVVVLAGNPGANEQTYRDAGVDRFIFISCDVLATLRELLREEGVLTP